MTAYYNEIDPHAAAWLRELITAGAIADGVVDERSIEDVKPDELVGFTQCHFFAGIGGWSHALRLAGIPDDYPVWTGSCPCQPFSAAGKGAGFDDERHLWPSFAWLIAQCAPSVVFGEQVASKAADAWIDHVQADLEVLGYGFGAVAFPAAGIGAPHLRDRLYWVGVSERAGLERLHRAGNGSQGWTQSSGSGVAPGSTGGRMADTAQRGQREQWGAVEPGDIRHADSGGDSSGNRPGPTNGFWRDADWLFCRDGKWRSVEPGTFPLVDGIPRGVVQSGDICLPSAEARTMRLRGYGNAIVPQQASIFIEAALHE